MESELDQIVAELLREQRGGVATISTAVLKRAAELLNYYRFEYPGETHDTR